MHNKFLLSLQKNVPFIPQIAQVKEEMLQEMQTLKSDWIDQKQIDLQEKAMEENKKLH